MNLTKMLLLEHINYFQQQMQKSVIQNHRINDMLCNQNQTRNNAAEFMDVYQNNGRQSQKQQLIKQKQKSVNISREVENHLLQNDENLLQLQQFLQIKNGQVKQLQTHLIKQLQEMGRWTEKSYNCHSVLKQVLSELKGIQLLKTQLVTYINSMRHLFKQSIAGIKQTFYNYIDEKIIKKDQQLNQIKSQLLMKNQQIASYQQILGYQINQGAVSRKQMPQYNAKQSQQMPNSYEKRREERMQASSIIAQQSRLSSVSCCTVQNQDSKSCNNLSRKLKGIQSTTQNINKQQSRTNVICIEQNYKNGQPDQDKRNQGKTTTTYFNNCRQSKNINKSRSTFVLKKQQQNIYGVPFAHKLSEHTKQNIKCQQMNPRHINKSLVFNEKPSHKQGNDRSLVLNKNSNAIQKRKQILRKQLQIIKQPQLGSNYSRIFNNHSDQSLGQKLVRNKSLNSTTKSPSQSNLSHLGAKQLESCLKNFRNCSHLIEDKAELLYQKNSNLELSKNLNSKLQNAISHDIKNKNKNTTHKDTPNIQALNQHKKYVKEKIQSLKSRNSGIFNNLKDTTNNVYKYAKRNNRV